MGLFLLVILAMYFNFLPSGLAGQNPFLLVMGEAFRYIGDRIPIIKDYLGGGTSAGAIPMSQMFGEVLGKEPGEMLAVMTPAVALGNACSIIMAGLLDRAGKAHPALTRNGTIMRTRGRPWQNTGMPVPNPWPIWGCSPVAWRLPECFLASDR